MDVHKSMKSVRDKAGTKRNVILLIGNRMAMWRNKRSKHEVTPGMLWLRPSKQDGGMLS